MKIDFKKILIVLPILLILQSCNHKKKYHGLWIIEAVQAEDSKYLELINESIGMNSDGCTLPGKYKGKDRTDIAASWNVEKGFWGQEYIIFKSKPWSFFNGKFQASFVRNTNSCKLQLKNSEFLVQMHGFGCENINKIGSRQ